MKLYNFLREQYEKYYKLNERRAIIEELSKEINTKDIIDLILSEKWRVHKWNFDEDGLLAYLVYLVFFVREKNPCTFTSMISLITDRKYDKIKGPYMKKWDNKPVEVIYFDHECGREEEKLFICEVYRQYFKLLFDPAIPKEERLYSLMKYVYVFIKRSDILLDYELSKLIVKTILETRDLILSMERYTTFTRTIPDYIEIIEYEPIYHLLSIILIQNDYVAKYIVDNLSDHPNFIDIFTDFVINNAVHYRLNQINKSVLTNFLLKKNNYQRFIENLKNHCKQNKYIINDLAREENHPLGTFLLFLTEIQPEAIKSIKDFRYITAFISCVPQEKYFILKESLKKQYSKHLILNNPHSENDPDFVNYLRSYLYLNKSYKTIYPQINVSREIISQLKDEEFVTLISRSYEDFYDRVLDKEIILPVRFKFDEDALLEIKQRIFQLVMQDQISKEIVSNFQKAYPNIF